MTLYELDIARKDRINALHREAVHRKQVKLCNMHRGDQYSLRWRIGQVFIDLGVRIGGLSAVRPVPANHLPQCSPPCI